MQKDQSFFKPYFHFIPPLLSVILMMLASGFFTTFVSLYLNGHGVAKENIGLIQSAFYLGMLLGAFRMESLIRRVGHIQALAVFASLASGTVILQLISQNLIVWGAMRFLNGMSLAAIYIVIESWMLDYSTVKTRGVILSLYM
ncbi:MAG: MFS transporter, partial [Simkaniaceae bacterium]|nr:MFS transporter [Simkaniaceae bacterium]